MDLRTKLVFALVTVALGSMLALGFATYPLARDLVEESATQTLEGIAESKANDLENLVQAWRDRVSLIASRTQLRISIASYSEAHDAVERERVLRILEDARRSAPAVRSITAYDVRGHAVASTAAGLDTMTVTAVPPDSAGVQYAGLRRMPGDGLDVVFVSPLVLEAERVGTLEVVLVARELLDITTDRTGLGETGDVVIAERVSADSAVIVNPTRHDGGAPMSRRVALDRADDPITVAVLGNTNSPLEHAIDYRGEEVWAATRYLPEIGWGLVVKFDADEQEQPVLDLRRYMIRLALALSAFAILSGTVLGLRLARPIRELADVANRIRSGDLDARAEARGDDEIGLLARTFNLMAAKLIETNRELAQRVDPDHPAASPGTAEGEDPDREPGTPT